MRQLLTPQGHGVDECGIDLVDKPFVVFLNKTNTWQTLHGYLTCELEIMHTSFEIISTSPHVAKLLSVQNFIGSRCFLFRCRNHFVIDVLELLLSSENVSLKIMKVIEVRAVEFVQAGDVAQQLRLVPFKVVGNGIDLSTHAFILLNELGYWRDATEQFSEYSS